jgi:hypothetical protein
VVGDVVVDFDGDGDVNLVATFDGRATQTGYRPGT